MKVLFVYNPWNTRRPNESSYDMKLKGSFEAAFSETNEHTYEVLHYGFENDVIRNNKTLNEEILKRDFDAVFVSEEMQFHITKETAKKLGKKLFNMLWDTWISISSSPEINLRIALKQPKIWGEHYNPCSMKELSEYCNIIVSDTGYGKIDTNIYAMSSPYDTRIYYPNFDEEKSIDISHNGNMYIPERIEFAKIFHNAGVDIDYGSKAKGYLTNSDYVKIHRSAKISLCYTNSIFGPNHKQRKGRIDEIAACGGFMLMTNPEVMKWRNNYWFEDGVHYVSMDQSNCVDKVKYYLSNPDERSRISKNFYDEWNAKYSPRPYWEKLFSFIKD